jgi:hypothetical protein
MQCGGGRDQRAYRSWFMVPVQLPSVRQRWWSAPTASLATRQTHIVDVAIIGGTTDID